MGHHRPQQLTIKSKYECSFGVAEPSGNSPLTVSKTGSKSKAERLMTLSTAAVAICCCSDFGKFARLRLHVVKQIACSQLRSPPGRQEL